MDKSLMYFRFYSTSTTLTILNLTEKIRNVLKEMVTPDRMAFSSAKSRGKVTAKCVMNVGGMNHKQGSNSSVLESASQKTNQGHQRNWRK